MKKSVLWITQTAVLLALIIVTQMVTKLLGQLVTGSIVNFILAVAVLSVGLSSGIIVALLSPFFAFLFGIGLPIWWLQALIAVGNIVLVMFLWLFVNRSYTKRTLNRYLLQISGIIIASSAKFFALWGLVVKLALPLLSSQIKPAMVPTISATFSVPQLITALIGTFAAVAIVPTIKLAINKK